MEPRTPARNLLAALSRVPSTCAHLAIAGLVRALYALPAREVGGLDGGR